MANLTKMKVGEKYGVLFGMPRTESIASMQSALECPVEVLAPVGDHVVKVPGLTIGGKVEREASTKTVRGVLVRVAAENAALPRAFRAAGYADEALVRVIDHARKLHLVQDIEATLREKTAQQVAFYERRRVAELGDDRTVHLCLVDGTADWLLRTQDGTEYPLGPRDDWGALFAVARNADEVKELARVVEVERRKGVLV